MRARLHPLLWEENICTTQKSFVILHEDVGSVRSIRWIQTLSASCGAGPPSWPTPPTRASGLRASRPMQLSLACPARRGAESGNVHLHGTEPTRAASGLRE